MPKSNDTLLITGATGFLGGAVVAELLEHHPQARLLFLVRAADARTGLERLRASLSKLEVAPSFSARLNEDSVLCGDLASFPDCIADPRVQAVTHVLNVAALASFAWKPDVWNTNVDDTLAFAAAVGRLPSVRRFVYVGTAMICGDARNSTIQEDDYPADVRQFVPYTRSKAEIERRLSAALGSVPLVIARPSIVVGHTTAGCKPSPSIFWMFRMIHAVGRVPFGVDNRIDIIPVDYCARALVFLLLKPELAHIRYHVSSGVVGSCSFAEIHAAYSHARPGMNGHPLAEFEMKDLPAMEPDFEGWFGTCNVRQMTGAIRIYREFAGLNVIFDNSRLLAEGVDAPPRFTDYLPECVRTGETEPIAVQMKYDFR
jgi:nucleoside-diphosphate-sugar epimerase